MSNKDRYQNTFGKLHLSEDFREKCKAPEESGKGKIMNFRAIHGISRAAAAAVTICTIALGSAGVCYANDIGGIRTTVQMWMNGSRQEVEVIRSEEGIYTVYNEDGKEIMGFGGVSIDEDGNETPIGAEEFFDYLNNECSLDLTDDGRYIFSYKNITDDVTDLIGEDGSLYVHVEDPANPYTYFNITNIKNGGFSVENAKSGLSGKAYYEAGSVDVAIEGDEDTSGLDFESTTYTTVITED